MLLFFCMIAIKHWLLKAGMDAFPNTDTPDELGETSFAGRQCRKPVCHAAA